MFSGWHRLTEYRLQQTEGRQMGKKKFSIAIFGLAVLCTSPGWAGGTGNGEAQTAKAHYTYCFGGLQSTVYFTPVITSAPTVEKPDPGVPFGAYLTKTYGVGSNNGGQCFSSEAMADIVSAKKQREAEFVYKKWKIVEVEWKGNQ
jgi:hypothetical protein